MAVAYYMVVALRYLLAWSWPAAAGPEGVLATLYAPLATAGHMVLLAVVLPFLILGPLIAAWPARRISSARAATSVTLSAGLASVPDDADTQPVRHERRGIRHVHAVAKGLLFLSVGSAEHGLGSRDIEDMRGLLQRSRGLGLVMAIGIVVPQANDRHRHGGGVPRSKAAQPTVIGVPVAFVGRGRRQLLLL